MTKNELIRRSYPKTNRKIRKILMRIMMGQRPSLNEIWTLGGVKTVRVV